MRIWLENVLLHENEGYLAQIYRVVVTPVAFFYGILLWVRHLFYDLGLFKTFQAPIPVISIGNLVMGGTGKTEITSYLTALLSSKKKVAILARGVGRKVKNRDPLLVNPQKHTAAECGDEPWLLANRHPNALVIVCPDRVEGVQLAAQLGAEIALLDDGMQHRRLKRDYEIVIVQGNENELSLMPKGSLRDLFSRLKSVDITFFEGMNPPELSHAIPAVCFNRKIEGAFTLKDETPLNLKGKKVALFCGIAQPKRFFQSMQELEAKIVVYRWLGDHQILAPSQLEIFAKKAVDRGAEWIICTEKDRMKVPKALLELYPFAFVKQKLLIDVSQNSYQKLLQRVAA